MPDFLLIHGSCHGAWCWRDTISALQAAGHTARAIDLPSHGSDPTPIGDVTLETCRDAVLAASTRDTIIVGHSWGGFPISAAAEAAPESMRGLVFLCAYLPVSGMSMIDMRKAGPRQTIMQSVIASRDRASYTINPDDVENLFYHDCPPGTLGYALPRLCPQAIAPQNTPINLGEPFASVPKAYIHCAEDRTIPPEYQEQMAQTLPTQMVQTLECSHSPFFACPDRLAETLGRIAAAM